MPNWCQNTVNITGRRATITRVAEFLIDDQSNFSLEKIDPTPPDYLPNRFLGEVPQDENNMMPLWYSWRLQHWGTKWNVGVQYADRWREDAINDTLSYFFDSAWSPPEEACKTLSKRYKSLRIELSYDEPGNDFAGETHWLGGEEIYKVSYPSLIAAQWQEEEYDEPAII